MKRYIKSDLHFGSLEPPQDIYTENIEEIVEIDIDCDIKIDSNGDYEYIDESYDWAKPEYGKYWESEEGNVYLGDATDMVEHIDDMLSESGALDNLKEGIYHITGSADLVFYIEGLQWDDDEVYNETADATWDKSKSSLEITSIYKL